jgi:hypothetical protein
MREGRRISAPGRAWPAGALGVLVAAVVSACSLGTEAGERPTSARVRVEGTSPHQLLLITTDDLYEQYNPLSGEVTPVPVNADTTLITLPFDKTLNIGRTGSVYVELRNTEVATASVRLRVELDNGEGDDRTATLSDNAALIYYFMFTDYSW